MGLKYTSDYVVVTNKEEIRFVKRVEKLSERDTAEVWLLKYNSHRYHSPACGTCDMAKWSQRAPKAKQVWATNLAVLSMSSIAFSTPTGKGSNVIDGLHAGSKRVAAHSGDDCLELSKRQTRTQQQE